MPKWVNYLIQIVAFIGQIFNGLGMVLPSKYQVLGAGLLAGVQAIVAGIAHFYNPDGTSARFPWESKSLLGIVLFLLVFSSGCAAFFNPAGMTADQLHEFAKIKDASAMCLRGDYTGMASVRIVTVNVDKGVLYGVTIKDNCEVVFDPKFDPKVVPSKP